jgi:hypothetical protein
MAEMSDGFMPTGAWFLIRGAHQYGKDAGDRHLVVDDVPTIVLKTKCGYVACGEFTEIPAREPDDRVTCGKCRAAMGWGSPAPPIAAGDMEGARHADS